MKPENELLAEEVAFVNTCEKMAEKLAEPDRGRLAYEIIVYGGDNGPVAAFGSQHKIRMPPRHHAKQSEPAVTETKPLTLAEFDAIVRDGEADLPPVPKGFHADDFPNLAEREAVRLPPPPEGHVVFEIPHVSEKHPKKKGK